MAINIPIITSFVNTGIQAADTQLKKFGTSAKAVAGAVPAAKAGRGAAAVPATVIAIAAEIAHFPPPYSASTA